MSFWESVLAVWIVVALVGGAVAFYQTRMDLYD